MFQQEIDNIHTLSHEDITMQLKQEVDCANEEYGMHNFDGEVEELQVEIMPEHAPAPVSLTTISTPEKPLTIDKPSDKSVSVHKQRMFACKLCGLTFSRLYLIKRHLLAHVKNYTPQFQCTKCHHSYRRKESLLRHYRSCDGTTNLSCEFCNMAFKCVEKLTRHKSLRHSEAPAAIPSKTINEEDLNDENMSQYYDCFFESVERHVADKPVRLKRVKEKPKPDNSKLFGCKLCTFTGKRFADVKSHLFLHLKTRPFACDKCNRSFGRGDKLKRHMKTCNGKIVLSCDICNNAFQTEEKLAEHAKVHEGKSLKKTYALVKTLELKDLKPSNLHQYCTTVAENIPDNDESGTDSDASVKRIKNEESEQFVCPICYESFEQITLLEWHGRQYHENCQVLRCNQCDARFSRVYALNQHMQFHNIDADAIKVKDHECEKCLSRFKTRQSMLAHKKKHHGNENFACLKCAETFLTKDKLVEHLKMHEKSKFICSECGSSFLRNEYLIIHIKKHRGEKPYTCKFCNEGTRLHFELKFNCKPFIF